MAQVIWTDSALNSLEEIAEYIASHNPIAANKLVAKIFQTVDRLEMFPESGRKPPELEQFYYREVIVNPCRIFYKIVQHQVHVLYVMRQEQQLRRYLFTEDHDET